MWYNESMYVDDNIYAPHRGLSTLMGEFATYAEMQYLFSRTEHSR